MIADFVTPVAPAGWLELDGSSISTTTYASLYNLMTIQQTGTRASGLLTITGLPSTTAIHPGYYVFGTGITSGTTVSSVDSGSQITMSASATSSGTNTVIISPWLLNTGTIQLPNFTGAGRYRRARTSGAAVGVQQSDQFGTHLHAINFTSGSNNLDHTHGYSGSISGTTSGSSNDHLHSYTAPQAATSLGGYANPGGITITGVPGTTSTTTSGQNADHTHTFSAGYSGTTGLTSGGHQHAVVGNTNSTGSSETRPTTIICITCIKT